MSFNHLLRIQIHTLNDLKKNFPEGQLQGAKNPRIALVGRSNVGKSTLLNTLLQAKVAHTSQTPGKTHALFFYDWIKRKKILVDLPGYGFAARTRAEKDHWKTLISKYFSTDQGLEGVFLLLDARHGPTKDDLEALEYMLSLQIRVKIIFTKFDQLKTQSDRAKRKKEVTQKLQGYFPEQNVEENFFWVSCLKKTGIKELILSLGAEG